MVVYTYITKRVPTATLLTVLHNILLMPHSGTNPHIRFPAPMATEASRKDGAENLQAYFANYKLCKA